MQIKSEGAVPNAWIYVDVKGIDVGTYVQKAQRALGDAITKKTIQLPSGYTIAWSGQYEYMLRAQQRLMIVIPITLLIIILIIYLNTGSVTKTLIVLLAVPFSLVGAFWLLYLLGYNLSVAVWIGLIRSRWTGRRNGRRHASLPRPRLRISGPVKARCAAASSCVMPFITAP
jgi:Cu(I)/Ag(I) efflux system membrane protein CusA/SilA